MRFAWSLLVVGLAGTAAHAQWEPQPSGTTARLRGLSVLSRDVAWASGSGGTCLRTIDGGRTWATRAVPGAEGLDFRDLHAFDATSAVLLSIGPGEKSRIYRTSDGGASWALAHTVRDPAGFLDALAFWDRSHGLALGDPVNGRFQILATEDGGTTWTPIPDSGMPPALADEGAFAASGTCLVAQGDRNAWFGTGGATTSRVFRSIDRGRTWTAHETPVSAGVPSAGIFSLAFRDADLGVAIGGDYKAPDDPRAVVALTSDGGRTWRLPRGQQPTGYRSGLALMSGGDGSTLVAVGPSGSDVSTNGGESWRPLGRLGFDAVGLAAADAGWAVGEGGRIAAFRGVPAGEP